MPKMRQTICKKSTTETDFTRNQSSRGQAVVGKIPLAGIARVVGVSEVWLQKYVNQKYQAVAHKVEIEKKGTLNPTM